MDHSCPARLRSSADPPLTDPCQPHGSLFPPFVELLASAPCSLPLVPQAPFLSRISVAREVAHGGLQDTFILLC